MKNQKIAIILMNLGGPDRLQAIRPFLYGLFSDKRIIDLPAPLRQLVAWIISTSRAPKVAPLYAEMGGGSPILPNTMAQAAALENALGEGAKVFIAMRYWHPFSDETARAVKEYAPDEIVLLPLYPQFSTTTTASSLAVWRKAAKKAGLAAPTRTICCYPAQAGFIAAMAELIRPLYDAAPIKPRILFSAHGLPEKIIRKQGDPYVKQIEMTAAAIVAKLAIPGLDWKVTYQSRVGPVEWVKPYTDREIIAAGAEGKALLVAPIAFVSEHIETLVELDIENRRLALDSGCSGYGRAPTVSVHPAFIQGLADLVRASEKTCAPDGGKRLCPAACSGCICL